VPRFIQKITLGPEKEWWVGWDLDVASDDIPGLIRVDSISEAELSACGVREFLCVSPRLLDRVERRRTDRVHLDAGIPGVLEAECVVIRDISAGGVGIDHPRPIVAGQTARLQFDYATMPYDMQFEIVRSTPDRHSASPRYHSALRLAESDEDYRVVLRQMVSGFRAAAIARLCPKEARLPDSM
jgi:PilZ domain